MNELQGWIQSSGGDRTLRPKAWTWMKVWKLIACSEKSGCYGVDSIWLHSICQQIWKTQQWPQGWKRSVFIPIPKKGNAKEYWNHCTIALTSHASKLMLKILQARLQQYMNRELPDVQAGFRKGRRTRDQIANICWIIKKAREFQKHIYFLAIAM